MRKAFFISVVLHSFNSFLSLFVQRPIMATAKKTTNKRATATASSPLEPKSKKASASKTKEIKYADKSPGQPQLVQIFDTIKAIMKPYVKGSIEEAGEKPGLYGLISKKPFETDGRKFDEVYFAGIIVQKGYVGFYYMPIYCYETLKSQLKPELLKCLKGKTCFYIKKNDPVLFKQIDEALAVGYESYQKRGLA
ncbi:MAG: hypothetical protein JWR18_2587 [Segetibacter sp.]|nr:hypothetical protein [Segetibacter sp.]